MSRKHPARERLLLLVSPTDAAAHGTTPEDAVADAISEALLNQPSLRTCLVPGCLRQFDMLSCLAGDPPPRESWSGQGWATLGSGSIFPAGGHVCPDHKGIVIEHFPRRVKLPNDRWTVHCACGWTPGPRRWHGVLRSLWEEHLLTAAGTLPPEPPLTDPEHRPPLAEHTEDTLTELYDRLEDAEHERNELRDFARDCLTAYQTSAPPLNGVRASLKALRERVRTSSRDWDASELDAWLYGVLVGWGCRQNHTHDDQECGGRDVHWQVARRHGWDMGDAIRVHQLCWWIEHALETAPSETTPTAEETTA
ncbi:hypothetical protein IQ62_01125 [Streptomyces scabiei]|uniref:hypothetical protein n=1 Tax=Streptomyces scabiei TaxID=1930 RepID=UPI0004E7432D|nr:hypothetical protein [Streptomyces scabiei]KFG02583.1 hypothetical protein IQ62_01125 [Streptomyces scabiei]